MVREFLSRVLPEGLIVIAKPKGRGFKHYVCETVEQAVLQAQAIDKEGAECYFGLGALKTPRLYNEKKEQWEVRTGANIACLKSLFADVDIDAEDDRKYATREEAIRAIKKFCKDTQFPAPMIVSSGGGLHLYWPLTRPVLVESWRPIAAQFKESLMLYGLKIDPTRTADASSILRVVGTHNYKQEESRPVALIRDAGPYTPNDIKAAVLALVEHTGATAAPPPPVSALLQLESNTTRTFPPQDPPLFKPILMGCGQIQQLATTGGDWEPTWYAGLQVVRHCEQSLKAALFISQKYQGFDPAEMNQKLNQLEANDIGPATCKQFQSSNPKGCDTCAHKGKITSPIQLGRQIKEAPPPIVELVTEQGDTANITIPNPPFPYARRLNGGIVVRQPDVEGVPVSPVIIHEHDMYPVKRTFSERHETETTMWRIKQPLIGWVEISIEQRILAEPSTLHAALLSRGVYVSPARVKLMVSFMVAYITEIQKQSVVEKAFSRLGWRDNGSSFILAEQAYHADGRVSLHRPSEELKNDIPGLHSAGTLDEWKRIIQFYNVEGYEAHRFFLYTAFGAPLFPLTGYAGAIINASGKPGSGKSTTMMAVNSVWGHPSTLMVNGTKAGATANALQTLLGVYNNLPFCLDEITRMDPRVFGELCLSVNQGQGKLRNNRSGMLIKSRDTWGTIVLTSANTDVYTTLASDRRDAEAEAMRAFQIPMALNASHTKAEADVFAKQELPANYGHACHPFIAYVAANYKAVTQLIQDVTRMIDRQGNITSGERFWSAIIAANTAGAIIARKLGLLVDFPVEQDCKWAVSQIKIIRSAVKEHISSPREILSEFLDSRVNETLVVSQLSTPNIAPRLDLVPRGGLSIRHEVDYDMIWMAKSIFRQYCAETGAHFTDIQNQLVMEGIVVDKNAQKVLGAGTDFSKGQVRCWQINVKELEK